MQEEANQKTVGLVVNASKFTGRTFARAVEKYLQHRRSKIYNIKRYLLAALFNAPSTIDNYYRAEVNHDMHGF